MIFHSYHVVMLVETVLPFPPALRNIMITSQVAAFRPATLPKYRAIPLQIPGTMVG
jgi:hypothetical protein